MPRPVTTFCANQENNSANLLLHKHKEGSAQRISRYILHKKRRHHRERSLGVLDVSLKQVCE